jgi:hypothetical protein
LLGYKRTAELNIMATLNPALVDFNRRNQEFWHRQKVLMERRMADGAILATAAEAIAFEVRRRIPVRNQMSFEKALEDAAMARRRFVQQQARSGGEAAKTDTLGALIIDIVQQNPEIGAAGLLKELRLRQGGAVIDEIDETHIHFRRAGTTAGRHGGHVVEVRVTSFSTPISGLKHRLTRARKKIRKES